MRYTVRIMSLDSFLVLDALIAAGVIVGSLLFSYTLGRYSMVPMIAALGIGAAFAALAPYVGHVPGVSAWPTYQQSICMFAVVTLVAFFVFRRHSYFEPCVIPSGFERIICGIVIAGFILAVLSSFLSVDILATLSPHIRVVFADPVQRTLWLLSPVVMLGIMRGR